MTRDQAIQLLGLRPESGPREINEALALWRRDVERSLEDLEPGGNRESVRLKVERLADIVEALQDGKDGQTKRAVLEGFQPRGEADRIAPPPPLSTTQLADLPRRMPAGAGPSVTSPTALTSGVLLAGRYQILAELGRGGMGVVYSAKDVERGGEVALKVLHPNLLHDPQARERFRDEAKIAGGLSHPGIVRVFGLHSDGEWTFLTMELLRGRNLREEIESRGKGTTPFGFDEVRKLAVQLCSALGEAHKQTVHRDVKPENIWLCEDDTLKLMDFGIARLLRPSQFTSTGLALGTAYYMAPEQLKGLKEIDHRADQYATAVVLYELLTGDVPAGAIKAPHEVRKGIPVGASRTVMKALQGRPEDRFPDIGSFATALVVGKTRWRKVLAAGALAAALIGAAVLLRPDRRWLVAASHAFRDLARPTAPAGTDRPVGGRPGPTEKVTIPLEKVAAPAAIPREDPEARKRIHLAVAEAQSLASQAIERAEAVATELERFVRDSNAAPRSLPADEGKDERQRELARRVKDDRGHLAEAYKGNERLSKALGAATTDVQTGRTLYHEYPEEAGKKFRQAAESAGIVTAWWQNAKRLATRAEKVRERGVNGSIAFAGLLPDDPYQVVHHRLDGWWNAVQEGDGAAGEAQVQIAEGLCGGLETLLPLRHEFASFVSSADEGSEFRQAVQNGDAAIAAGNLDSAGASYSLAGERLKEEEPQFRKKAATAALVRRDYDHVIEESNRWSALAPGLAEPITLRARAQLGKEHWAKALDDAEAALALSPGDESASLTRVWACLGLRHNDKVEQACNGLIDRNPKLAEAYIARSRARTAVCRDAEAIQDATTAIELLARSASAWATRANAYEESWQNDKAVADCLKAIEMDPAWVDTYAVLAKAHSRRRDYGSALDACKRVLDLRPKDPNSFTLRACVLIAKRDYADAAADAARALELDAGYVPALLERGRAFTFAGKPTEALFDLNAAIEKDPTNPAGYSYRSFVYGRAKKWDLAEVDADHAAELSPAAEYIETQGELEMTRGKWNAAFLRFLEASRKRSSPRTQLRIGQVYGFYAAAHRDPQDKATIKQMLLQFQYYRVSPTDIHEKDLDVSMLTRNGAKTVKDAYFNMSKIYLDSAQAMDPTNPIYALSRTAAYYCSASRWWELKWFESINLRGAKERYQERRKEDEEWVKQAGAIDPDTRKALNDASRQLTEERKQFTALGRYRDVELFQAALAELNGAGQLGGGSDEPEYGDNHYVIMDYSTSPRFLTSEMIDKAYKTALKLQAECR